VRVPVAVLALALAGCGGADIEAYERIQAELRPAGAVERSPCGKGYSQVTCSYIAPGSPYEIRDRALERLTDLHFGGWGGTLGDDPVIAWSMDGKTKLVYTATKSGPPPGPVLPGGEWSDEWAEVTISIRSDDYHRCAIDCVPRQ
jgi:hypothetical protein